MQSQAELVLDHIMTHGQITSIEAFELYKITRISAVIFNLRHKDKIKIVARKEKIDTGVGKLKTFGIYSLAKTV